MNKEQKALHQWFRKKKLPYWEPQWILVRLAEEVGEFARAVNHEFGPKKKKDDEHNSGIEEELGDTAVYPGRNALAVQSRPA